MSDQKFEGEPGDLCVSSINTKTLEYGVKPVAVFRADEVDEDEAQVKGDVLWTNDERLMEADGSEHRVEEGRISSPFVHTEPVEE